MKKNISEEKMKTVLIIDDDEDILDMYRLKFESVGFRVSLAARGEQGMLLAEKERPSILLLDVQLPDMTGMEVLSKVRKAPWGANMPIIMLTNMQADTTEAITTITTYKPNCYLIKADWTPAEVLDKANEVLR